jgi:signal transduction histidine kinase/ligand-binding sensor domain-containing protein
VLCSGPGNAGRRPLALRLALVCLLAIVSNSLVQAQSAVRLQGLYHDRWTVREQAPSNIKCLAQAQDGYLWLGTDHGLFRFNGVSFDAYRPKEGGDSPSQEITAVSAGSHGGLWIGYESGEISFLEHDHLINYGKEGRAGGSVWGFALNADGQVWAATEYGLVQLVNQTWRDEGLRSHPLKSYPNNLFFDTRGTLWASTSQGLLALRSGQSKFVVADPHPFHNAGFAETSDGSVWMATTRGEVRAISSPKGTYIVRGPAMSYRSTGLLSDEGGGLLVLTVGEGIAQRQLNRGSLTDLGSALPSFTERDSLTGNFVIGSIRDREGSIWVVTTKGLDRFRAAAFTPLPLPPEATYIAIAFDASGALMVGTDRLLRFAGDKATVISGAPHNVECAYRDPHGVLWLGNPSGLWRLSGSQVVSVPLPPSVQMSPTSIQAITQDRLDVLWVSFVGAGVFRLDKGEWSRPAKVENLPPASAIVELTQPDGRMWFGYSANRIGMLANGEGRMLTDADGIDVGNVSLITDIAGQLWIGGKFGLEYLRNGRFWNLKVVDPDLMRGISGLVEGKNGDLWINTISGVHRLAHSDIEIAFAHAEHSVHSENFGYLDGIVGTPEEIRPLPTALRAADGRLYFAARGGVSWLDPRDIHLNALPPPTWIKSALVDGIFYDAPEDITLRANARNVVIDYTANSLLIPQRVRFRHMLVGLDTQWQDAGTQREAFYSRLPPGNYTFRVVGSNNDGVWNNEGASLTFRIPPSFVQSLTFKLICAAIITGLLWSAYLVRVHQLTERIRSRLLDRMTERERIARDLHDTFLQGVQGVLLSVHTATRMLHGNEDSREMLEEALVQSDKVMLEGRDMVMQLRGHAVETSGLPDAIAAVGNTFAKGSTATFSFVLVGVSRDVHSIVRDDIYRIGREAVANAFNHASAHKVEVELTYSPSEFRLRVRDDGTGIDPSVLKAGGRTGHWGMPGMRERAEKIGGRLELWSRANAGTEVDLRIPSEVAYALPSKRPRFRWLDTVLRKKRAHDE